jgi:CHAT domain-containing protein
MRTNEIQQLLDPETVLLEYSLGDEHSYLWFVTAGSVSVHELPKRTEIEKVARQLYRTLTARTRKVTNDPDEETARWRNSDALSQRFASDLTQILLAPVADVISEKRLLIVSDGALQYIPFSALPDPGNPGVPLIFEHEVVNLPSASVLAEIRRANAGRPNAEREVAVLADPVFDVYDDRVTMSVGQTPPRAARSTKGRLAPGRLSAS